MFAATTSPSYSPTCVSGQIPFTSPIAHSRSPARRYSSTRIPRGSGSIPTVSSPIPSTRGLRPVATSRRSPRSSLAPSNRSTYSSPSRTAPVACIPSLSSIPSRRSASLSASPRGAGSRGSTRSAPSTITASPPNRRTTCASSTPAEPPPRTSSRRGTAFMLVASRVPQMPSSSRSPGIGERSDPRPSPPRHAPQCAACLRPPPALPRPAGRSRAAGRCHGPPATAPGPRRCGQRP